MFKYPKAQKAENISSSDQVMSAGDSSEKSAAVKSSDQKNLPEAPIENIKKDVSPEALRELLEKNLKWSQIIYEQTRKINSKLFWKSVWSWALFIIFVVVPTVFSVWYLPPMLRQLEAKYQPLFSLIGSGGQTNAVKSQSSVEDILKLLPISDEQKAMLKAVLGNK